MPTVISKYIDHTAAKYNIPKEHFTRSIVAAAIFLYGLRLGYPYIQSLCNKHINNHPKIVSSNGRVQNSQDATKITKVKKKVRHKSPGINKEFIIQLLKVGRIMLPGIWTPEVGLLTMHTAALATRTFLSIYVASMEGQIVKYIVRKDVRNFAIMLLKWLGVAVPATFINSMIRYLESKLSLAFSSILHDDILHKRWKQK